MPESQASLEEDQMFRNHNGLADFGKDWNLFEELSFFDIDVEGSFHQIANSHLNIGQPNLSTKLSRISTKLLEIQR
jgi:hypothetical protein